MSAIVVFILLFALATARAITTAINKTYDVRRNGYDELEKNVLREDAEHWWMAVLINSLMLSVGVVLFFAPEVQHTPHPWQYTYIGIASLVFAVLINIRIERHGYYYRRRNDINIFGRPREEGLGGSLKRMLGR